MRGNWLGKAAQIVLLFCVISWSVGVLQDGGLELRLVRNFGYGGLGEIQGSFTLKLDNPPQDLQEVTFYLDGKAISSATQPPYQVKFSTGDFVEGEHYMYAVGVLENGVEMDSNRITKVFLSSEQAWTETQRILIPLLGGTAVLTLLGVVLPLFIFRGNRFQLGVYGPAGGSVCPRCSLPFSRPLLAPNLLIGKLVRCPHCGKVSVLAKASTSKLKSAEARFANQDTSISHRSEEEELARLLEESRYDG
jgi:hypothetical protein